MKSNSAAHRILIIDDTLKNIQILGTILSENGYQITVAQSGLEGLQAAAVVKPDLILLDIMMPGMDGFETCQRLKADEATASTPIIFLTAKSETDDIVKGFEAGAVDYVTKPFSDREVLSRVQTHLRIHTLARELADRNQRLETQARELTQLNQSLQEEMVRHRRTREQLSATDENLSLLSSREAARWGIDGFIGQSHLIQSILNNVRRLQTTDRTSVLISGESGTGKELVARAIHFGGTRAGRPFISVNCATIPATLAESLLFGQIAGTFTGAKTRKGYFELASGGSLFLDEIGDLPLDLQPKLLRAIESGTVLPVGGTEEVAVDVRILAATNKPLQAAIADRKFREDLYFRLARFPVEVPPLRERKEDIPLLVRHFLTMFAGEMGLGSAAPAFSDPAIECLLEYDFPGNIRELKNIVECALIRSDSLVIQSHHLNLVATRDNRAALVPAGERVDRQHEQSTMPKKKLEDLVIRRAQGRNRDALTDHHQEQTDEERILNHVREYGSIDNEQCRALLNTSKRRATYLLNKLYEYGLLSRSGQRRWAQYELPTD